MFRYLGRFGGWLGTSDVHDRGTIVTWPSANSSHTVSGPCLRNSSARSPQRGCSGKVSCTGRASDQRVEVDVVAVCRELCGLVNLNVHLHLLVPDGVFAEAGAGLAFVLLPAPAGADLLALLDRVSSRASPRCSAANASAARPLRRPDQVARVNTAAAAAAIAEPEVLGPGIFPAVLHGHQELLLVGGSGPPAIEITGT